MSVRVYTYVHRCSYTYIPVRILSSMIRIQAFANVCVFSRTQADACSSLSIPSAWFITFVRPTRFFSRVRSVHALVDRSISINLLSRSIFLRIFLNTRNSSFLSVIGWFEGNRLEVFLERSPAGRSSFKISAGPTILGHGISAIPPRWNALLDWERMDSESRWKLHSGISEFHPFISRTLVCILVSCIINWNNG